MVVRMSDFLSFVAKIGNELYDLWVYARSGNPDPEAEKQIAARIIRKAIDEEARREIKEG